MNSHQVQLQLQHRRQRHLWIGSALYLAAIYASLPYIRQLTDPLRDAGWLRFTVVSLFALAALVAALYLHRRWPGWRRASWMIPILALYGWVLRQTYQPEEQLHLIEYGLLGLLIHTACRARRRTRLAAGRPLDPLSRWPALGAIFLTTLAGWGDEAIQHWLPERHYDLRDVAFNAAAAALAIAVSWVLAEPPGPGTPRTPRRSDP